MSVLVMDYLRKFATDEVGATAIEYGLISAMLGVSIIAAINSVGDDMVQKYDTVVISVQNANP